MPDLMPADSWSDAMEAFYFSYRPPAPVPDEILALRGLGRVHHRILFFIARQPGLSVKELLATLGVSKQALNLPLRQLQAMQLISSETSDSDKRKRLLALTREGAELERALRSEQARLLQRAFAEAGEAAVHGWLAVNQALARPQDG